MSHPSISLDKVRGMLIGVALGDALGVPHEFRYQNAPYTGKLEHRGKLIFRFQGTYNLAISQISDDTELSLTLARSLVVNHGYHRDHVVQSYLDWANSGQVMMGTNTRELFKGVTTIRGYEARYNNKFSGSLENSSQSNGATMRCSPLAMLSDLSDPSAVLIDCALTNPHPTNLDCNRVYVAAVRLALQGVDPVSIMVSVATLAQTDAVREVLTQVLAKTPRDISYLKGWCLHGLYCAMWCLLYTKTMAEALDWVIGQHPRSDTDTNAAIAGGLMGALLGYNALVSEPRTAENIAILRACDTRSGDLPRPLEYTLHDFDDLTQQLHHIFCS
jgi:ADP-ribosyl-[dinitrogen reductase] hydrolase